MILQISMIMYEKRTVERADEISNQFPPYQISPKSDKKVQIFEIFDPQILFLKNPPKLNYGRMVSLDPELSKLFLVLMSTSAP